MDLENRPPLLEQRKPWTAVNFQTLLLNYIRFVFRVQGDCVRSAAVESIYREALLRHPDLPRLREVAQAIERKHGCWSPSNSKKIYTEVQSRDV